MPLDAAREKELYSESDIGTTGNTGIPHAPKKKMGRFRTLVGAATVASAALLAGCYTTNDLIWVPRGEIPTGQRTEKNHELEINSVPPGAHIFIGGRYKGITPLITRVSYQVDVINRLWGGKFPVEQYGYFPGGNYGYLAPIRQELFEKDIPRQYQVDARLPGYHRATKMIEVPGDNGVVFFLQKKQ